MRDIGQRHRIQKPNTLEYLLPLFTGGSGRNSVGIRGEGETNARVEKKLKLFYFRSKNDLKVVLHPFSGAETTDAQKVENVPTELERRRRLSSTTLPIHVR